MDILHIQLQWVQCFSTVRIYNALALTIKLFNSYGIAKLPVAVPSSVSTVKVTCLPKVGGSITTAHTSVDLVLFSLIL